MRDASDERDLFAEAETAYEQYSEGRTIEIESLNAWLAAEALYAASVTSVMQIVLGEAPKSDSDLEIELLVETATGCRNFRKRKRREERESPQKDCRL